MQVAFVAAEAAPFVKVGGLADVVGSLPRALAHCGVSAMVFLPKYGFMDPQAHGFTPLDPPLMVPFEGQTYPVRLWRGMLPNGNAHGGAAAIWLENDTFFTPCQQAYPAEHPTFAIGRYLFFSECLFAAMRHLDWRPDILHAHDWHTAAAVDRLASKRRQIHLFQHTASVFTIHNLAYQGQWGDENWLARGIRFADAVTTVSPTYAWEIQTPEGGYGLDGLLRQARGGVRGILNGIDPDLFNPATDPALIAPFEAATLDVGKRQCKQALQAQFGLPQVPERPVFVMISRLVEQKGLDILLPALHRLAHPDSPDYLQAQWVILGNGEAVYEDALEAMIHRLPQLRIFRGYQAALSQQLYAGADFFMMPSRFEPCGLSQLIAMRYGTVPVVRATGGLADTVTDFRDDPATGVGIRFGDYSVEALVDALKTAAASYPHRWRSMALNSMGRDFSWQKSAQAYCDLYAELVAARNGV